MRRTLMAVGVVAVAAVLAACGKEPARTALAAADAAIEAVRPEAETFAPAEWVALREAAEAAHGKFTKGDYTGALSAAQALPAKASEVATAAAKKKQELLKAWADLQGQLPQLVRTLTEKVGALSRLKTLPKDVEKAAVENAAEAMPGLSQTWQDAVQAAASGDVPAAVARGEEVKARAEELASSLGLAPAVEAGPAK
ncbi:MAG: hypothetical protein AB7O37_11550 [Vicinamibacteria bacterium]